MKYYAGLDIAMKETFICILSEEGKQIYEKLTKGGVFLEKAGLETGSISHYLTKGSEDLGCNAICIDTRKMTAILSVTINKTYKNDARGIVDAMHCNNYKEVYVRDINDNSIAILLKFRATLIQSLMALKNTVRGYLKSYEIRLGDVSHKKFSSLVREYYPNVLLKVSKEIEF